MLRIYLPRCPWFRFDSKDCLYCSCTIHFYITEMYISTYISEYSSHNKLGPPLRKLKKFPYVIFSLLITSRYIPPRFLHDRQYTFKKNSIRLGWDNYLYKIISTKPKTILCIFLSNTYLHNNFRWKMFCGVFRRKLLPISTSGVRYFTTAPTGSRNLPKQNEILVWKINFYKIETKIQQYYFLKCSNSMSGL